MGKNRDDYQQAQQNLGSARSRASDTEGGSTGAAYAQAHSDLTQATKAESDAWAKFMDDPEG